METKTEKRFISDDAKEVLSLLPSGLNGEYLEKVFRVIGRTKVEEAAPELLEALIELKNKAWNGLDDSMMVYEICQKAIKKATE